MKEELLEPFVARVAVPPTIVTAVALAVGLGAAASAAAGWWLVALALFLANRVLDGLDGEIARARSTSTDAGGYADMMADTLVYAAVPVGAAIGSDLAHIWPLTALLLGSFYVNTVSWTYLSAVIEKRGDRARSSRSTAIEMPAGLVEGTETVGFFVLILALPSVLDWTVGVMAAAVAVGALVRFVVAHRRLRIDVRRREAVDV